MTVAGGRRYALLLALNDSEYAREAHGGYGNVFVGALRAGAEDAWDCFRVIDGEFPAAEDLPLYDGFVVSGSPHDAHGDGAPCWVRRLCRLLRAAHAMGKRVLGVCFGHQALCRALGGEVGRAPGGWAVGVKEVTFTEDAEGFAFMKEGISRRRSAAATIIEVHQDEVWEVPPGGKVLAYSDTTRVEMFAVGDNALGIQGHPEYANDILLNLIDRLVNDGTIDGRVGDDARRTAERGGPDREFWTGLCKRFLRGDGAAAAAGRSPLKEPAAPELGCGHHVARFPSNAGAAPIGL